jgi:hypothetical protein
MKKTALAAALSAALLFAAACKKQQTDNDAIRAGIIQHLISLKGLNVSAMEINVSQVTINGNQAQAVVDFRPKTGAAAGAGMQVSYNLEKRDANWVVLKSQPLGGEIAHPAPGQMPPGTVHPSSPNGMPNFSDILPPAQPGAPNALPPGHPPVNAPAQSPAPSDKPQQP